MKNILFIICFIFFLAACKNNSPTSEEIENEQDTTMQSTAELIANANGFENWDDVKKIHFTFNVDKGENHYERSWKWEPKTSNVSMYSTTDTIEYNRADMDSIVKKTDAAFINDKYWLLAPFNLLWDDGTTITETKNVKAPISKKTLDKLTLTYGNEGGYTPGDAYDFYFGDSYKIEEWVFREGNDSIPSMTTTWSDYENFNGIEIAKMHQDSTGNFKLYFTNILVER